MRHLGLDFRGRRAPLPTNHGFKAHLQPRHQVRLTALELSSDTRASPVDHRSLFKSAA